MSGVWDKVVAFRSADALLYGQPQVFHRLRVGGIEEPYWRQRSECGVIVFETHRHDAPPFTNRRGLYALIEKAREVGRPCRRCFR